MVEDVVCRMMVDETDQLTPQREFEGRMYYFCSTECKLLFTHEPTSFIPDPKGQESVRRDIVCGGEIGIHNTRWKLKYHGRWKYFCSESCKREFERNPARYTYFWV